ncbi:hypothetical protein [Winogradskyella aurantiaca]|uniref:hypothetical protein n=1 Tax=Winogradskyella aurantiaca TaxID=2219558 RepID=UPI000E1D7B5C|nr:hypothetical protein [Winogradskyella aurantiaca]
MQIDYSNNHILERIKRPGSARQLAVFRILLGLQIFYSASSELLNLLQVVNGTEKPTIFPQFMDNLIAEFSVPYLQVITQVLSVFLILGLFGRLVKPLLFTSFLLLFSFWYSHFDAPVPWLYLWFPLLILMFARSEDVLSLDKYFGFIKTESEYKNTYRWPVELVSGWFVYIYVAAGLAKIIPLYKGVSWLDGGTSQGIIYDRFLNSIWFYVFKEPVFDFTTNGWLFASLSIGSLLIELFCIIIFFTNKFNILVIFLIVSMHFFLYLAGVPGFMQTALVLSVCLLPIKYFEKKIR